MRLLDAYAQAEALRWDNLGTRKTNKSILGKLQKHFGNADLITLSRPKINEYVLARKKTGVKNSTINRELAVLQAILSEAEATVKVSSLKASSPPPKRLFSYTEEQLALQWFAENTYIGYMEAFLILMTTGFRYSEMLGLKRGSFDGLYLSIHNTKNGDSRAIPVTPGTVLHNCLLCMYEMTGPGEDSDTPWRVNPEASLLPDYVTSDSFRYFFDKMRASCGLKDVTIHSTRHTFITRLIKRGVHPLVIQKLSGHRNLRQLQAYTHLVPEDTRLAMDQLSASYQNEAS